MKLVRLVENNDWVTASLFLSILALVFVLISLNRGSSIKEFITQKAEGSSNVFLSWVISSAVFCLLSSVLFSQYIPIVPKFVDELNILGISLNKLGYCLIVVPLFYLTKAILSFIFYQCINQKKRFMNMQFSASRLYFSGSIVLILLVFINYYFDLDRKMLFPYLITGMFVLYLFKLLTYSLNERGALPKEWFYKILYICTLQIAPMFVLWRLVFFN